MKVSTAAAGDMGEATVVSSASHSPPPESGPPEQKPAAKAPVLPVPELQTSSAVSMTAALKNVGAVSTHLQSGKHELMLCFFNHIFPVGFYALQITPMKESLPDLERATIIQVSARRGQQPRAKQSTSGCNPHPGAGCWCFNSQTVLIQGP